MAASDTSNGDVVLVNLTTDVSTSLVDSMKRFAGLMAIDWVEVRFAVDDDISRSLSVKGASRSDQYPMAPKVYRINA